MIINWIVKGLLTIFGGLIGLFPSYTLPGSMTDFGTSFGSSMSTLNGIFPVVTLGICIAAIVGMWLFISGWNALIFVYRLIPLKMT